MTSGALWLVLAVLGECAGAPAAGWIPAYGATGEPVAWYYSRGC